MKMTMTKFQIFGLLTKDGTAKIRLPDGREGVLVSILRESGSGRSFMFTVNVGWRLTGTMSRPIIEEIHVETVD